MGKVTESELLYEAERCIYIRGYPKRFTNIKDAFVYLEYVLNTKWFYNRWPTVAKRGLYLKDGKGEVGWYDSTTKTIALPLWALNNFTILHEVAHAVTEGSSEDHGDRFILAHLALVRRFLGSEAGQAYYHSLRAYQLL